jgi:hypothetical protein
MPLLRVLKTLDLVPTSTWRKIAGLVSRNLRNTPFAKQLDSTRVKTDGKSLTP